MKSLLFITSELPYPPVKGGVIVSWNLLKNLASHYRISLFTLLKDDDRQNEKEMFGKVDLDEYFGLELDIPRSPAVILKSYFQGVPINFVRKYAQEFQDKVNSVIDQYDYVLVDHYEMYQYIPDRVKSKVILNQHNAEFVMWQRYSEISKNPLKKLVTGLESRRIKAQEKDFCTRADLVVAFPNDTAILKEVTGGQGQFEQIVPCGDDYMLDYPDIAFEQTEKALLYIGSLAWEANRDGLVWFINEAWEKLKQRHADLKFYIVGGNPDPSIVELAQKHQDIILTGFVDDLEDYYPRCRVFVSPLRFGSGIKLKVVNAMLRGLPTVTTPIGAEGMPIENGKNIFASLEIEQMVADTSRLLTDQGLWESMRDQSRVFAGEHFSWPKQIEKINRRLLAMNGAKV
jgi:glycosyltransferase involved in cell wall biosynthesis